MSARTTRTRLLAAAALTVATLSLTACNGGEGVRDEGASAGTSATPSDKGSEGSSTGKGKTDPAGSTSGGDKSTQAPAGSNGTSGSNGSSGTSGSESSAGTSNPEDSLPGLSPCTDVRTTATTVSRPLNHLLLTVTNTGSKNCHLPNYPAVKFGDAQSVPPVFDESIPQAVVTLAPGESGYAGVLLSAADGSGSNGYTAKSLTVYLSTKSQTPITPSLPAKGVYVDDKIQVTYWQTTMDEALAW